MDLWSLNHHRRQLNIDIANNPKNPINWITAANLEEYAENNQLAMQLIHKGCQECPKSENLWQEAYRLASKYEELKSNKTEILIRGLEHIPDSIWLWKEVLNLSNDEEHARVLLRKAVKYCPFSVDFWLALVRLETSYEDAKMVLDQAREKLIREEPAPIWIIASAQLEEAWGKISRVGEIVKEGVWELKTEGVVVSREVWLKVAEAMERGRFFATCQAIIGNGIGIGVEDKERKRTWIGDAEECEKRGSIETARAIYAHALTKLFTEKSLWVRAAQFEKRHGTKESVEDLFCMALSFRPQALALWLAYAEEKRLAGDVPAARSIFEQSCAEIPNSEELWVAASKLEFENNEFERARMLLSKARDRVRTERVWMKSAIIERKLGNVKEERRLLYEGLKFFPSFYKLWLMLGQLEERLDRSQYAKVVYELGLKHCPNCTPLLLSLANVVEKVSGMSNASAFLTNALNMDPKNAELWLAAVRAEWKNANRKEFHALLHKALQECPNSGILWAAAIDLAPQIERRSKMIDAIKKCGRDPHVMASAGKWLLQEGMVEAAKKWLYSAVMAAPDIGDIWALCYLLELHHGSEVTLKNVVSKCVAAKPKHGEKWQAISKSVENSHQSIEYILKKVAVAFGKEKIN